MVEGKVGKADGEGAVEKDGWGCFSTLARTYRSPLGRQRCRMKNRCIRGLVEPSCFHQNHPRDNTASADL